MKFFEGFKSKRITNQIVLHSNQTTVWKEITNVMIYNFRFPLFLRLIGIPKPLSAKIEQDGVGGYRVAKFSNGAEFHQVILEWELLKRYRFNFNATDNFKVGHFLNLSHGPFKIETGGYNLIVIPTGIKLELISNYKLNGFLGKLLHLPFRFTVFLFQKHLLKAIESNCNVPSS
ncbi:MAG: hypothetical protein N4A41_04180 [Crocinitomicaceae bacterium]|jgi:hypothetical protein|nr:hypothetical protein [Crocinitomicaceae bacterium]